MKLAALAVGDISPQSKPLEPPRTCIVVLRGSAGAISALLASESVYVEVEPRKCPLPPRQLQALQGLRGGLKYAQIAEQMGVSVSTARTHIKSAYQKLGVSDRAQAVLLADEEGWL